MNRFLGKAREWAGWITGMVVWAAALSGPAQNPIHVTYLWHMHQPIYYPRLGVTEIDNAGLFSFNLRSQVFDPRTGPYTDWPRAAVQAGADRSMPHAGVQVSFSGSLMENLNGIWAATWPNDYRHARNTLRTVFDNPRMDLVGFAYHHSLMPLTSRESMRMQIRLHRRAYEEVWNTGGTYSKGFFPPESSFAMHMIPALVQEGLEWVLVDNGHIFRTLTDFPWSSASSIRPNRADQRNGSVADWNSQWTSLQNIWAPTPVAAPFSYQPHFMRYVDPWSDPQNPTIYKMIVVPTGRYEGNENGRGGYGAWKPQNVWGAHVNRNNNSNQPMLIVAHSDGDNHGMFNREVYYGSHAAFLDMVQSNADFEHTTIQDYLQMYPPPTNSFIHVEPGSWIGTDGGTPYYNKWLEYNAREGEHPDHWNWSVLIAALNRVLHAEQLDGAFTLDNVRWGTGPDAARAWYHYLNAEASDYWYWDFDRTNPWDGNVTRAANLAVTEANKVLARHPGVDDLGPSIFHPQRPIWNPGGKHWDETIQPSDFEIWTFVADGSGLSDVRLFWRTADMASYTNLNDIAQEIFAHTPGKNTPWTPIAMAGALYPTVRGPLVPEPLSQATRYSAQITGQTNALVSYFVEAVDLAGNTNRSEIFHVWVGEGSSGGGGGSDVVWTDPASPNGCGPITIFYDPAGRPLAGAASVRIHIGTNGWQGVLNPDPSMTLSNGVWTYRFTPAPLTTELNFVFNNGAGTWDNNGGQDWRVVVTNCNEGPPPPTGLAITNPPADVTVSAATASYDLQGIAENITGSVAWSNRLTGASGSFPATTPWTLAGVSLGVGTNEIVVSGTVAGTGNRITNAADVAANYGGSWANGSNLGTGFGPWSLQAGAQAGHVIGPAGWGMWSRVGSTAEAVRTFAAPMGVGDALHVTFRNKWVLEGQQQVGVSLRDAGGNRLMQYHFNGGEAQYRVEDAGGSRTTGIVWTDQPQAISFELLSATTYKLKVGAAEIQGTYSGTAAQARIWSSNGGTSTNYDLYVDALALTSPGTGGGVTTSATVRIVRSGSPDSNGDGVPDAWYAQYLPPGTDFSDPHVGDALGANGHRLRDSFFLGLDPNSGGSRFRWTAMSRGAGALRLEWAGMDDRRYVIQHASDLVQPFESLPGQDIELPGDGSTMVPATRDLSLPAGSAGYYRLRYLQRLD